MGLAVTPGAGATIATLTLGDGTKAQLSAVATMQPVILSGNQTLSVATGSNTTLTVPSGATHALMTVDTGGGDIRYWEDGSSPSSSAGLLVQPVVLRS